ncbi:P-loop NTPase fold protein [Streptomyces sp. ISL-66]|uniref:P-loop NTPase fold protein n=1 Tax=Streptomyces sp. ISL-66 TaxID=2819186 RepID=UPI0027E45F00|nr:P-loop NTPase fold protein [Streptomyces sp. ISL-66]
MRSRQPGDGDAGHGGTHPAPRLPEWRLRAREFLEKIIQVRLDLPTFGERDAYVLVERSLAAVLNAHNLTMTAHELQRLGEAYHRYLQSRLRTPRAIKRFFGQVDATLGSLVGNVDFVDFLIVTFLRTNEPGAYRLLWQHRAEPTGTSVDLLSVRNERPEQRTEQWTDRLAQAGVAEQHVKDVIGLMGLLFPHCDRRSAMGAAPRPSRSGAVSAASTTSTATWSSVSPKTT